MLELKNIKAGYGKKIVLNDVSVKLQSNAITVIMGANGAGKSTLIKKLLIEALQGPNVVLIENEFGEIGV